LYCIETRFTTRPKGRGTRATEHKIEGPYPNIERVISPTYATRVTVDAGELANAARLAGFFATHSQNVIRLSVSGGGLVISANAAQVGKNTGEVAATLDGQEGQLALNVRYLLEAIGAAGRAGAISLDFQSAQSPGIVRRVGDASWVGAIMPMALRS
jgi:DNA polymerase-3 subunit beta